MVMVDPTLREKLLEDLERLTGEQQRRVVEYAQRLRSGLSELPPAPLGRDLRHLAGTLDRESAREMREAIEEEFER